MNRRWAFASLVLVGAMASALFLTNDAHAARPASNNIMVAGLATVE